ncbi:MAG TPA: [citrate (pro-3S)-lyase] ligase [Vicinamibacterales bacterium]|jgi:[citrate (pro-3S)-lyase] ligase
MVAVAVPLLTAGERAESRRLVESHDLTFEDGCDEVVGVYDAGRLVATGARGGYVLKMFAIEASYQGGDVLGELATSLIAGGRRAGHDTLFVFTRPEHAASFASCHFRLLATSGAVTLLEYGPGLEEYLRTRRHLRREGRNGAVVVNGNPFTRGHLHLVETAARLVSTLYLFVVREDRSVFPFDVRLGLAQDATRHLSNVVVLDTSRYAVSAGTFPSYFLRKNDDKARLQMRLDVRLFGERLAPAFGITERFVGHEPYCETTAEYNRAMAEVLPQCGIGLTEIPRLEADGRPISATTVRAALAAGNLAAVTGLVPPATMVFLESEAGRGIASRLQSESMAAP